jgi:hypothetical protein
MISKSIFYFGYHQIFSLCLNVKEYFQSTQLVDTTHVFYSIPDAEYTKGREKPIFEMDLRIYLT